MVARSAVCVFLAVFLCAYDSLVTLDGPRMAVSALRRADVDTDGEVEAFDDTEDGSDMYGGDAYDDEYDEDYDEEEDGEEFIHETFMPPDRRGEYEAWVNNDQTTLMWSLVDANDLEKLKSMIAMDSELIHIRSEDGRGLLFWAYEYGRDEMVEFLLSAGADPNAQDAKGVSPAQLRGNDGRSGNSDEEFEDEDDEYDEEDEED